MKKAKTLKEFSKITRKYYKRNSLRRSCKLSGGKKITTWWSPAEPWVYYPLTQPKDFQEKIVRKFFGYDFYDLDIESFMKKFSDDLGQKILWNEKEYEFNCVALVNSGILLGLLDSEGYLNFINPYSKYTLI